MKISIVGLGLIGGSFARDLKSQIGVTVYGVENHEFHRQQAIELGLVAKIITLEEAIEVSDVIILAVPVDILEYLIPQILDKIQNNQIVIDLGSTKELICSSVETHPNRGRFIAAHPLAGTEFSGPTAALRGLFMGKKNLICESEKTDKDALQTALIIFESLGLESIFMSASEHDKHLAYVSHLSHVSSFMLGMTVLEIEKDEKQILNLASTGFASTVRLAKSNPKTWSAIFDKNNKHLSRALDEYILWLQRFKEAIESGDKNAAESMMIKANEIKKVLP
jgi:prephenate dehydrogenase